MSTLAMDRRGRPIQAFRPGVTTTVALTATAAASPVLSPFSRIIRVYASVPCHIAIGEGVTATPAHMPLSAGTAEYLARGSADIVSAIKGAGAVDGLLYITEMD